MPTMAVPSPRRTMVSSENRRVRKPLKNRPAVMPR